HVVEDEAAAAFDLADDVHDLALVGALAALVDDGQGAAEALGVGAGPLHAAGVGGDDDHVGRVVQAQVVVEERRHGEEVVEGDVEEALDLRGVQVDGDDAADAGGHDEVGDQLGGDGRAGGDLAVLPGVAVVGDDGGDGSGRGAAERVDHDEQLHHVVVDRR